MNADNIEECFSAIENALDLQDMININQYNWQYCSFGLDQGVVSMVKILQETSTE